MTPKQAYINGFIKRAAEYGVDQATAVQLLKESIDKLELGMNRASSALGDLGDAGKLMYQGGVQRAGKQLPFVGKGLLSGGLSESALNSLELGDYRGAILPAAGSAVLDTMADRSVMNPGGRGRGNLGHFVGKGIGSGIHKAVNEGNYTGAAADVGLGALAGGLSAIKPTSRSRAVLNLTGKGLGWFGNLLSNKLTGQKKPTSTNPTQAPTVSGGSLAAGATAPAEDLAGRVKQQLELEQKLQEMSKNLQDLKNPSSPRVYMNQ